MKRAAIYARVSTEEQKKNYSVGEQIRQLKEHCERQGWEVTEEYIDSGFTGSNTNRPALRKLLNETDYFDVVVVWKLDRLSRSIVDTMTIIEQDLIPKDIQFIALAENLDTMSPTWITQAGIYSTIAQSEREAISERMKMGKLARAKSGKPMSWHFSPFGYSYNKEKQTYDIVPLEADIIRRMFKDYEKMGSVSRLRNVLNEEGYVGKDTKWNYRTVKQNLSNPVYAGYNKYKGEIYKGNHEPLIEWEQFQRVQDLMEERRIEAKQTLNPRPFQGKYMLSGQIKCGHCLAPMEITQYQRVEGERIFRYRCQNKVKPTGATIYNDGRLCDSKHHFKDELEGYVLSEISKLQIDQELVLDYSKSASERLSELNDYERALKQNGIKTQKLVDLYMADLIDTDELNSQSQDLKSEERFLQQKINELLKQENDALNYLKSEPKNIYDSSYEEQKRVVEILIDTVYVEDEEIRIVWDF